MKRPNLLFVFGDQWRASAFGYAGNSDVRTPNIDRFAALAVNVPQAVSSCPTCSPYRASLLTGQTPLTHGVFTNDAPVDPSTPSFGTAFRDAGYHTAYIGKWHIHGNGRGAYIPPEHRLGFEHWKVLECTHEYYNSQYYAGDDPTPRTWDGYDAYAQTDALIEFLRHERRGDRPFAAFLSWGPPHAPPPYEHHSPYDQFPPEFADAYPPEKLRVPANVPEENRDVARELLSGYYAHCSALDVAFGKLIDCLEDLNLASDTIVVFTSDHGDMLGSQGLYKKQSPFAESVDIPLLFRIPGLAPGVRSGLMIEPEDMMPTLLSLCDVPVPDSVEGIDCSAALRGEVETIRPAAMLSLYVPNGQWRKGMDGGPHGYTGREYRGLKTDRFSYVRDRSGPWLLFDNRSDPLQLNNLVDDDDYAGVRRQLDDELFRRLEERSDAFEEGVDYIARWGYEVDEYNAVKFTV